MELALLAIRLLLATVFAVAGLAKLADLPGSRQAVADFGVPERMARPLGLLLPLAELATAVLLVPIASARWGALASLLLLLTFVVGMSVNLARGRAPDCHCFGQLHSAPAGWRTLLRNGVLAAGATFLVWWGWDNPGASAVSWLGNLSIGEWAILMVAVVFAAGLIILGWLVLNLLRQHGRLLLQLESLERRLDGNGADTWPPLRPHPTSQRTGLAIGVPAPGFSLSDIYGETLTLDTLMASAVPNLLLFTDPQCVPCTAFLPEVARWQREYAGLLTVSIVSRGSAEANRAKADEHGLSHVVLQQDQEVAQVYQARGTPSAVLVRADGTIGSSVAAGTEAIRALVVQTIGGTIRPLEFVPRANRHSAAD